MAKSAQSQVASKRDSGQLDGQGDGTPAKTPTMDEPADRPTPTDKGSLPTDEQEAITPPSDPGGGVEQSPTSAAAGPTAQDALKDAAGQVVKDLLHNMRAADTQRQLETAETERKEAEQLEDELKARAREEGQARGQWARFVERRAYVLGGGAMALGFAALTAVILMFGRNMHVPEHTRWIVAVSSGLAAWLSIVAAIALPNLREARKEQRRIEAEARDNVAASADALTDVKSLVQLIRANRRQMSAYDVLAQAQARTAFRNSQIAMCLGLLVLVGGAVGAISVHDVSTKVATASLTAIGGALSGYIAGTFLQTYSGAVAQLNFHFQQPLITNYLLTAQRLIDELPRGEKRDAALDRVISRISEVLVREWIPADAKQPRAPRPQRKSKPKANAAK